MAASCDKSKPYMPLADIAPGAYSRETEATATCFCGAVQLAFPTEKPGLVGTFVCHCVDCRKITGSMFASNFTIADSHLRHLRGQDNLQTFAQDKTPVSGKTMTNYFCKTCGALMYRKGAAYPGVNFLRIGTVDDFNLHETKLKPQTELFVKDRVGWIAGVNIEGIPQVAGMS
ncbi:hypothetical protein VHEMI03158 [[Torrubiella] hemipterigena]|uniref:CENP-V/GFA domain-containing protein n=1 Tax=[Torrubiella] hemipterigena TaxID=1531966 RepID=A0A0A1TCR0_9HYPO|nr:hypothetical protein VHEMI03158 [[Torrubiella] hemipterigena]